MKNHRPNILILFTDMQRADTIHALGNPIIKTPHLDRLVAEGTAFTNCFSPSPVCCPARCCMHYGLYPQKTGLFDNGPMMDDNGASYPALLGEQGYRTHAIGKCHFTPDRQALRGFQSRQSQEEVTADPDADEYIAWLRDNDYDYYEAHGARGDMYYIPQVSTLPAEAHPTQWVGTESERFVRESANGEQPWCLYSSYIHPHPPFAPPKPWHKLYRVPEMPLPFIPENSESLHTWVNRFQNRYKYRDRGLDMNLIRLIIAYYYATISFVDYQVGRILNALEETGQLDNTLILFASDHGEHLGDLGCFGKRSMHDASARVPMIVRYPERFPMGARCATATSLCDLLPTVVGAANGSNEALGLDALNVDGQDLAQIAANPDPERIVYAQFAKEDRAIYMAVSERWKYVYSAGDQSEFFFDRQVDPAEARNLANEDGSLAKMTMKENLLAYLASVGANEAVREQGGELAWKEYPKIDETYLADPDARLLFQDYPSYPTELPGYSDAI
ncbi:MAG: sulfatase-like hydrolase/transferase [Chloroflexota bacterium]